MIKKISLVIIGLGILVMFCVPVYCQEHPTGEHPTAESPAAEHPTAESKASYSGEVVSVDLDNSVLKVSYLKDPAADTYEEIDIAVTPEIKMLEGEEILELSDLDEGDLVAIEGSIDNTGKLKVDTIRVQMEEAPIE